MHLGGASVCWRHYCKVFNSDLTLVLEESNLGAVGADQSIVTQMVDGSGCIISRTIISMIVTSIRNLF